VTPADFFLMAGDDLVPVRLPGEVAFVEPPPPLEPLPSFREAVRHALEAPLGSPPLARLTRRGARVTVAFDDPCLPLPPMLDDPRRVMLEEVVRTLEGAGVREVDMALVCANGLHRQWTRWELLPLVGPALSARFGGRVTCYDAADPSGSVSLGRSSSGLLVEVGRAVAEADLVVYVGVPWTEMNGGHKSLACGLSTYASIDQHHGPEVQEQSPLMHPGGSEMHRRLWEIGRHIGGRVPVFQVEAVVDNRVWAGPLQLLDLRRRRLPAGLGAARRLPPRARRWMRKGLRGFYRPAGVWAGAVEPVHEAALTRLAASRASVDGQADILVLGLPDLNPYAVHSDMNPLLVANLGLGYAFQFGRPVPLVRPGGWVVLANPCSPGFNRRHHPAYERFWDEVLPVTRDPARMRAEFQDAFVDDAGLIEAYRHGRAYHPAHPFYAWYWTARAQRHVGGVVIAGCTDPAVVERLGFRAAARVEEGVALARSVLGGAARVVVQLMPPVFSVDVCQPGERWIQRST